MSLASAAETIPRLPELAGRRVLVVGDVVLDRYVVGTASRLSREAPVPVVVHEESFALPGSAANPSLNIQALGSQALQVSAVGDDPAGTELVGLLAAAGVDTAGIVRLPGRPTNIKQRILARGSLRYPQQLVRIDWLDQEPIPEDQLRILADRVAARSGEVAATLLSDYQGGTLAGPVLQTCLEAAQARGVPVCVDAQDNLWQYRGVSCVKCNRDEASRALGVSLRTTDDFEAATREIMSEVSASVVAITRGPEGMSLRHRSVGYMEFPAPNRTEVFDVVGAGDTVIAIMSLGMIAGWHPRLMATVAQLGAGLVIQKLGNATPSLQELETAARRWL